MTRRPPLNYRTVMNVLEFADRPHWYERLSAEQRRYLKTTALHAAHGGELYRVDAVLGGEVIHTATVSRVRVPGERRLQYSVTSCRSIGNRSRTLHGPWFDYCRTRAAAERRAKQAVSA